MGAGFDKPANARHYTLQFPRVQKIHDDRTYRDAVSFDELQDMARKVADPLQNGEDSQVELRWVEKLQSPGSGFDYSVDRSTATTRTQCSSSATTESTTLDLDADILEPRIPKHEIPDRISCQPRTRGLESETRNAGSRPTEEPSCHQQKRKLDVDVSPPPYGVGKRARASAVDAKGVKAILSENVNKASTPMQPFCTGRTAGLVEPAVPSQQPPRGMVSSSNSIKAPALSGDMVNFTPPFLLGPSLYYLFSHPRQPLSKTLGRLKMSFTFSTEYLLDHVCALSAQVSQLERTCMRMYGVFMDAARTEVAAQELDAITQAVRNRQETGRCAQGCRAVFFDWNLIGLLQESNDDPSGTIWRSGFVGCLAFIGENNTRLKELWTWEEAIQGSHET